MTSWPPLSNASARAAPTRPQPTITNFTGAPSGARRGRRHRHRLGRDRLADDPDLAGCVLEDVGNGAPDREIAPEALAIGQPDDEQVRLALRRLVDQRRPDLARLEQHRLEARLQALGLQLGVVEDLLGRPPSARRCPRRGACDQPTSTTWTPTSSAWRGSAELGREADDAIVAAAPGEREDGAPEGAGVWLGHLGWAASRWEVVGLGSGRRPSGRSRRPRYRPGPGLEPDRQPGGQRRRAGRRRASRAARPRRRRPRGAR